VLLLLVTILSIAIADQQVVTGAYAAVAGNNELRVLGVQTDTLANSIAVGGYKVMLDRTSGSATAQLDAGGFKFGGGVQFLSAPQLGFSVLDVIANFQWTANANGNGSILVQIQGALAEMGLGFHGIFAYQERNSKPGFQYAVGDRVFDCSTNNNLDCIVANSYVDMQNDLVWSPITYGSQSCVSKLIDTTGYNNTCTIYQITTTGSILLGPQVIQITLTLASQKILLNPAVNGHEIGPDRAKFDIQINYPWASKPSITKATSNVALLLSAAGKAVSGAAQSFVYVNNNQQYQSIGWVGAKGKATVLAWDGSATLTTGTASSTVNVYVNGISGASISAYTCSDCTALELVTWYAFLIVPWKAAVNTLTVLGWTPEIVILSWDQAGADQVLYDPIYGTTASTDVGNSGVYFAPTILLSFIWVLIFRFFYH